MTTELVEYLRTASSVLALGISALSVWFTRRLWAQSNRPVVSAVVRTASGGNHSIAYDIAVINSGTRPAITVRLTAQHAHVLAAMEPAALSEPHLDILREEAVRVFSAESVIPLLLNGETVTNAFGVTGNADAGGSLWRVGASIAVQIEYADLEGRSFVSNVVLKIKDTAGFAGGFWSVPK